MKKLDDVAKLLAVLAAVLALLGGAFMMAGCGTSPTNANTPVDLDGILYLDQAIGHGLDTGDSTDDGPLVVGPAIDASYDEKTVTVAGGVINLEFFSKNCLLVVPPAAVLENTTITAFGVQAKINTKEPTLIDFGPDGLEFNVPAQLIVYTDQPVGSNLRLYWYNPDTKQWEVEESRPVVLEELTNPNSLRKVQFLIHHFSKYGIS